MIGWMAGVAMAVPADTEPCSPFVAQGIAPADGAVVPPDAVFTALGEPYVPLCTEPLLELYHDGSLVGGTVAFDGVARWWFGPTERLEVGEIYEFWVSDPMAIYAPTSVTVTVDDVPPPDPTPGAVSLSVDHRCDLGTVIFDTEVQLASPASGVIELAHALGTSTTLQYVPVDDSASASAHVSLRGGGEPCVEATLLDLAGRPVWTTARACEPTYVCPSYGEPVSVVWTMEPLCDTSPATTVLHVEIDLPKADPETTGLLLVEVTNDLGSHGVVWGAQLTGANGDTTLDTQVAGTHDVCFDLVMVDPRSNEESWRSGPYCSEEPLVCADDPRPTSSEDPKGCGCTQGGGGGAALPLWWLVAWRRRSRSR